jgi:hypothetical protein
MKKVLFLLFVGIVCAGVATANYSYSVSGKVYYNGTSVVTVVPNASVTLEVEWVAGSNIWSGSTQFSANDGSFSFSITSDVDPKNKNMRLKASKDYSAGSTAWNCSSNSETKDVWISLLIAVDPHLSVGIGAGNFAYAGTQSAVTTVAYLDEPRPMTVQVTEFRTVVSYDSTKMGCTVGPAPDSFFDIFWMPGPEPGTIIVNGYSRMPMGVPLSTEPTSFFDVFFDVLVTDPPSYTHATVEEGTELYIYTPTGVGVLYPYPHRTEFLLGTPEKCKATFLIEEYNDWEESLMSERPYANIRPMSMTHWQQYMDYWHSSGTEKEGEPYPSTTFVPCVDLDGVGDPDGMLYVWGGGGGGGGGALEDAGLVMAWKYDPTVAEGNYASAWEYDYGQDPDLRNCTIQVTVTPPAPPPPPPVIKSHINAVSFSIVDVAGRMRTWWWSVPAAIPLGIPTTVKINTAIQGVNATTPVATGYMNVPGFNLAQSQFFDVDENFKYIFQQYPVPPPGQQQFVWAWNYWHNLTVTKNTAAHKGIYIKYSQKPEVIDTSQPPLIYGWNDFSSYPYPIVADDWPCNDDRPVTDIHWWGSFIGWTQPYLPPNAARLQFHIGIWTDVPANDPGNQWGFSHPGKLIWENYCTNWTWNFAGYDKDPRCDYPQMPCMKNEACFQFTQLLSEDQWFYQDPNDHVYWLSIAPVQIATAGDPDGQQEFYQWGWKTRPHTFNDDAVRIYATSMFPPTIGAKFLEGVPIQLPEWPDPTGKSWDMAFEITTNEPKAPASADLNYSGFVDLADFAIFAQQWLSAGV